MLDRFSQQTYNNKEDRTLDNIGDKVEAEKDKNFLFLGRSLHKKKESDPPALHSLLIVDTICSLFLQLITMNSSFYKKNIWVIEYGQPILQ